MVFDRVALSKKFSLLGAGRGRCCFVAVHSLNVPASDMTKEYGDRQYLSISGCKPTWFAVDRKAEL